MCSTAVLTYGKVVLNCQNQKITSAGRLRVCGRRKNEKVMKHGRAPLCKGRASPEICAYKYRVQAERL